MRQMRPDQISRITGWDARSDNDPTGQMQHGLTDGDEAVMVARSRCACGSNLAGDALYRAFSGGCACSALRCLAAHVAIFDTTRETRPRASAGLAGGKAAPHGHPCAERPSPEEWTRP